VVMVACHSCDCLQMNGLDQMVAMVVMVVMLYFKVNLCVKFLLHSAMHSTD